MKNYPRMGVQHQEKVVQTQEVEHLWRKVQCVNGGCELGMNGEPLVLTKKKGVNSKRKNIFSFFLFNRKTRRTSNRSKYSLTSRTNCSDLSSPCGKLSSELSV